MIKILLIITLHILLLANLQFIPWPENLTWPYLNIHGLSYYRDIFVIYPPLYWELLTNFYKFAGISINNLQILSYIIIALSDYLLWLVSKKNWKVVAIYIPLQIFFEGNGIWVDHLLIPFFLLSYQFLNTKKYFLLGLCLGFSLLTKQTAVYFIFGSTLLLFKKATFRQIAQVGYGIATTLVILSVYLIGNNNIHAFWTSAIDYILFFHPKHPLQFQLPTRGQLIMVSLLYIPIMIRLLMKRNIILFVLLLTSSLGIFTRFEYFHLQPALPFLAIALSEISWTFIFYLIFISYFLKFLLNSWHQPPRFFDKNIINQSQNIQSYVTNKSTLFVNTWDQYYYLTDSLPSGNFFVPSTPWTMDYPGNQEKIVSGIQQKKPNFIFYNECFRVKEICYVPKKLNIYIESNYTLISKLTDGTSIFQYNPMSAGKIIEPKNRK